ncbi:MAG TPA: hypothetical protein DEO49_05150 [Sutterella sp.]|nr:hypothetical protein [Sutterella sp.]
MAAVSGTASRRIFPRAKEAGRKAAARMSRAQSKISIPCTQTSFRIASDGPFGVTLPPSHLSTVLGDTSSRSANALRESRKRSCTWWPMLVPKRES